MHDNDALVDAAVLRLRILVGAMIAGVLLLSAIVIFMVTSRRIALLEIPAAVFYLAIPALAVVLSLAFGLFSRFQRERPEEPAAERSAERIVGARTTRTIVGAAMAESVGLLSAIGYLVTGRAELLFGVAASLIVMVRLLPRREALLDELGRRSKPA